METDKVVVVVETTTKVNDDASATSTSGSPSVLILQQEETKDANNASSTSTAPSLLAEDSNPSENKKLSCSSEILQSPTRVVELSSTTTTTANASTCSSTSSASAAPSSTVLSMPETSVVVKKNDEQTEETASPATQIKPDDTSSVDTASRTNSSGVSETKVPLKTSSSLTVPASKTAAGIKTVTTPVPGKVNQSTSPALSKKQSSSSSSSHSTPNKAKTSTSGGARPSSPSSAVSSSSGGFAAVASKAFEAVSEAVSDVRSAASDVAAAKANAASSSSSNYHDGYDYNVMTPYQIFGSKVLGKTIYGEFECTNRHHFGSLYMGSRALCFYGKLFGLERKIIMPYGMICNIERYKTNGILIKVDSKANSLTDGYGNPLPSPPPPKFSPKSASAPSSPKKKAYTSLPISIDEYVFYVDLATLDSSSAGATSTTGSEHTNMSVDSSFNSGGSCASDMDDVLNLFLDLKERFKCGFLADDDILGTGYTGGNNNKSTHSKAPKEPPTFSSPQAESPPRTTRKPLLSGTADDLRVSVRYLPHPMYRRSNTAPNSPKSENDGIDERHKNVVRFDDTSTTGSTTSGLQIDLHSTELIHVGETKDGTTPVLKPSFQGEAASTTAATTTTTTTATDRPSMKGSRTNSQALAAVTAMADFRSFSIVYGSKEKQQELAKMTYDLEHEDTPTKDTTTSQEKEEQVSVVEPNTDEEKTSTAIQNEVEALTEQIQKEEEVVPSKKMKEQEEEEQKMEIDDGPEDEEDKIDIPTNVQLEWNKIKNETPKQYKDTALKLQLSNCTSVDKFFKLFLSDTAPYSIAKYMEHHGDIELNVSKWKLSKRQFVTKRIVKYVHPVNAPMAPPQAAAQKNQWMRKYSSNKIVIDTKTSVSDVPMTDCFYMQDRWLIESDTNKGDGGGVTLTVHFQVTFVKSTMFRRIIEKTSKEEFLKFIKAYGQMVQDSLKHEEMKEKAKLLPVTISPLLEEEKEGGPSIAVIEKKEEGLVPTVTEEVTVTAAPPSPPAAAAAAAAATEVQVSAKSIIDVLPPFIQQILHDPKKLSIAIMGIGIFIIFWMITTFMLTYMTYQLWKEVSLLRHDIDIALTTSTNNGGIVPAGEFVEDIMNVPIMDG